MKLRTVLKEIRKIMGPRGYICVHYEISTMSKNDKVLPEYEIWIAEYKKFFKSSENFEACLDRLKKYKKRNKK